MRPPYVRLSIRFLLYIVAASASFAALPNCFYFSWSYTNYDPSPWRGSAVEGYLLVNWKSLSLPLLVLSALSIVAFKESFHLRPILTWNACFAFIIGLLASIDHVTGRPEVSNRISLSVLVILVVVLPSFVVACFIISRDARGRRSRIPHSSMPNTS